MSEQLEIFCKLMTVHVIGAYIAQSRQQLHRELYEKAIDNTLRKRRFRMLSQIADYESQIYKKIYRFHGDAVDDYILAIKIIIGEISSVTDRSS